MLAVPVTGISQDPSGKSTTSGKIVYQDKVKLNIKLEGDAAQFAASLPEEQTSEKVLYFNTDYSLYQADDTKKEEDVMSQQADHMTIKMVVGGAGNKTFCDFQKKKKTEQKEFMTRMFLVESELGSEQWKLTGNFRMISGYNCQEALWEDTARKVNAWFTASIPVSSGPQGFGGLPGLILQVDINNGKQIITATSVDPSLIDAAILVRPKEGKKVTAEGFKKIVDEKMKEMGNEGGDGTNHIFIRIKN
jgi:GLPGLI family protein